MILTSNKNTDCETMEVLLNCFACYEQSEKGQDRIYHIIIY